MEYVEKGGVEEVEVWEASKNYGKCHVQTCNKQKHQENTPKRLKQPPKSIISRTGQLKGNWQTRKNESASYAAVNRSLHLCSSD